MAFLRPHLIVATVLGTLLSGCAGGHPEPPGGVPDQQAFGEAVGRTVAGRLLLLGSSRGSIGETLAALELGADPDVRQSGDRRTPLMLAADGGHVRVMQVLIVAGADVDVRADNDWTALMFAAGHGSGAAVRLLIDAGADVDVREANDGYTPTLVAAALAHTDALVALLDAGGDRDGRTGPDGANALTLAAGSRAVEAPQTVAELLVRGAAVDDADGRDQTPLIAAIDAGNEAVIRLLLDEGADSNRPGPDGSMPVARAAGQGRMVGVGMLIDAGGDPNSRSAEGRSALDLAADGGHVASAALLIGSGADIDPRNPTDGSTPLLRAVDRGDLEMVRLLITAGANPQTARSDGATAAKLAEASPDLRTLLDAVPSVGP